MVVWLVGCLLADLLGRLLACLLALFGLLRLLILICFAWLIFEARAVNLLALVWLELARLVLYLAYLLPCPYFSLIALFTLLGFLNLGRLHLACSNTKLALLAWTCVAWFD